MTAVNVAGLLHEPAGVSRELRLRDHYLALGPDVELAGPLDADLRLLRTNRGILLRGQATAPLRRTCARCTDPFVDEERIAIDEEFVPTIDPDSGAALAAVDADEEVRRIDEHHEIQLDPVFREELALSEPMVALCAPDCPGLCSECGARLDARHTAHVTDEIDPRLAGLAALLRDEPDSERE